MKKLGIRIILGLLIVLAVGGIGFYGWAVTGPQPTQHAMLAMQSTYKVNVSEQNGVLEFLPAQGNAAAAFIYYPGARVEPRAYAPLMAAIAEQGIAVFVAEMPLRMAVLNPNAADAILAAHPEISKWFIGGHSLGGVMAAHFAHVNPRINGGLVFWASYPAGSDDLRDSSLPIISISGSLDGLATPAKIEASRALLPSTTEWVVVDGGNHSQFGDYGLQSGDNLASISVEQQHAEVVKATVEFIKAHQ